MTQIFIGLYYTVLQNVLISKDASFLNLFIHALTEVEEQVNDYKWVQEDVDCKDLFALLVPYELHFAKDNPSGLTGYTILCFYEET